MKMLIHSAPPTANTGYGVHTRHFVEKARQDYDLAVHSVGDCGGVLDWNGIQVFPAGVGDWGVDSIPYWFQKSDSDVVFSHHDHWGMAQGLRNAQDAGIPMILYTILDHGIPGGQPPELVVQANENAYKTVVMSKWAEKRMRNSRVDNDQIHQIPHAFDTSKFAPVTDAISPEVLRDALGVPKDAFVFGSVAANYGPRKNLPQMMEAFSRIMDDYPDAYFYIHSVANQAGGYPLEPIRSGLGIPRERLIFPESHEKIHGMDDLTMVQLYNTFDVLMNTTQSESWGMTVTEALSCGTPAIVSNNSAMTEQMGVDSETFVSRDEGIREVPHGLLIYRGVEMWTQNAVARRYCSGVDDMEAAMRWTLENREKLPEMGQRGREFVVENYDWDVVWEDHWKPFLKEVEEDLSGSAYNQFYFKRREKQAESKQFYDEYVELTLEIRGDTVLDVGAGTGKLAEMLEEEGRNVKCVTYSEAAKEFCEEKGLDVEMGDIRELHFKDDSYDTVVTQHVLEHIEEDVHALAELARVAKRRVACIVPGVTVSGESLDSTEVRRYSPMELDRLKEEFEEYTEYEMDWKKTTVSENPAVYKITVDVESDGDDEDDEDDGDN